MNPKNRSLWIVAKKQQSLYPVYLFAGKEEEEIKQQIETIEQMVFQGDSTQKEINSFVFFGDEGDINDILDNCKTYPVFSSHKIIKLYNFDRFITNKDFLEYLENPLKETIFILITDKDPAEISKKLVALIQKHGYFHPIKKKWKNQILGLWKRELINAGFKYDNAILEYLSDYTENTQNEINIVIQHLKDMVPDQRLTLDIIKEVVIVSKVPSIFEFLDFVFNGDYINALYSYNQMIADNVNTSFILYQLSKQLKTLWNVKGLVDEKIDKDRISKEIGLHPFITQKIIHQASQFSYEKIEFLLHKLLELEIFLKSSSNPSLNQIKNEMFIYFATLK